MALNISITQPNPPFITPQQEFQFSFTIENDGAASVLITGIDVIDTKGLVTISSFGPAAPSKYQIADGGTQVTSSVPAWGTATQSQVEYYVGNVSGSTLQTIATSGSFSGKNTASWVNLPAGATGSYVGVAITNVVPDLTDISVPRARLQVQVFKDGVVQPQKQNAPSDLFLIPADIVSAQLSLVGEPQSVITKPPYERNPLYADFDVAVQTTFLLTNGMNWISPPDAGPLNNYTSSDPSVISVVNNGPYLSSAPSTTLTNSVGSIYGGQTTFISGGAGACSFTWANVPDSPTGVTTTISNEIAAGLTASLDIRLAQYEVIGLEIVPNLLSIQSASAGIPPATYDLEAYYFTAQGNRFSATEVGQQPTWSSSNSTAVPVSVSGTLTASVNTQQNVTITAQLTQLGSNVVGSANVILNYRP